MGASEDSYLRLHELVAPREGSPLDADAVRSDIEALFAQGQLKDVVVVAQPLRQQGRGAQLPGERVRVDLEGRLHRRERREGGRLRRARPLRGAREPLRAQDADGHGEVALRRARLPPGEGRPHAQEPGRRQRLAAARGGGRAAGEGVGHLLRGGEAGEGTRAAQGAQGDDRRAVPRGAGGAGRPRAHHRLLRSRDDQRGDHHRHARARRPASSRWCSR